MAHGRPDWSPNEPKVTTYAIPDPGEAAMRLGAISPFDRRGDIWFYDGFEDGLGKWEYNGAGSTGEHSVNSEHVKSGGWAFKVLTKGVTGGGGYAVHYIGYYKLSKSGIECSFSFDHPDSLIRFGFTLGDNVHNYITGIRYDHANTKFEYLNSLNAWVDLITDFRLSPNLNIFSTIKLVADFSNEKYVRAIINEREIDMSDKGIYDTGFSGVKYMSGNIVCTNGDVADYKFYFDDYIITINEP